MLPACGSAHALLLESGAAIAEGSESVSVDPTLCSVVPANLKTSNELSNICLSVYLSRLSACLAQCLRLPRLVPKVVFQTSAGFIIIVVVSLLCLRRWNPLAGICFLSSVESLMSSRVAP